MDDVTSAYLLILSTGMKRHYNDVPGTSILYCPILRIIENLSLDWKWQSTFEYFGAQPGQSATYSVSTPQELATLLQDATFQKAAKPQLVEVHMEAGDAPRPLRIQAELSAKANAD